MSTFLAVDFGAGSGRVIAGRVSGGQLELDELHRFPNRQVRLGGHVYWDFPALFEEMKEGLRRAAAKYADVESIGIDTWGVDYGLVDRAGNLMGNRFHGRHPGGSVRPYRRGGALRRNRHTGDAHQYDVPALCSEKRE